MILKFDIFTEIAIEVQKYLNTRIFEFNPPKIDENYQMRYYSWITNTTETDKSKLRELFIPTKQEILRNDELNLKAKQTHEYQIQLKKDLKKKTLNELINASFLEEEMEY